MFYFPRPIPVAFRVLRQQIVESVGINRVVRVDGVYGLVTFSINRVTGLYRMVFERGIVLISHVLNSTYSRGRVL